MTPCPYCDSVSIRKQKNDDYKTLNTKVMYRVVCSCGYATKNSKWWEKRKDARKNWETLMRIYEASANTESEKVLVSRYNIPPM